MTANSDAWKRFFENTNALAELDRHGFCHVTADDLKVHGKREPRLMAKLDTLSARPEIFRKHDISILPVQNGRYILFKDESQIGFFKFSDAHFHIPVERYDSQVDLLEFDAYPGSLGLNESQALDFAYISSLLSHFTGDSNLRLVIRGRQFCKGFDLYLKPVSEPVHVTGVQIEVDAGYETADAIYLVEAKIGKRDDFNIRQLLYPYLEWSHRTEKQVRSIFLAFTNGKYFITEFGFDNAFGSITIQRNRCYVINESPIPDLSLTQLTIEYTESVEPTTPYPQADDLDKVVDLVSRVLDGVDDRNGIADVFEFDVRQGDYYANAACYLDLMVRSEKRKFLITEFGNRFLLTRSLSQRTTMLFGKLMERPTFRRAIIAWSQTDYKDSSLLRQQIAGIIAEYTNLSGTTPYRRAGTVMGWLKWLRRNCNILP